MSTSEKSAQPEKKEFPIGTTAVTARLHTTIRRICYVLLFALVVEGAFLLPFSLVWYGWPTLSVQQICSGLHQVMYNDPTFHCKSPYPLSGPPFGGPAAHEGQTTAKDRWGVQPKPGYSRIGFRELITIYRENEKKAAAAQGG
ncbi:hypothetical protein ACQP1W_24205 [Spirillospora sp. CA-255316]